MLLPYVFAVTFIISIQEFVSVLGSRSCECTCNAGDVNFEELDPVLKEKVENITKELKVDTKNTSSHSRTLISAPDPRPSAQAAGYVGIILLTLVIGSLVLLDVTRLCHKPEEDLNDDID